MAISTPSDLVLDVVRAADPGAVEAAQEKLAAYRSQQVASNLSGSPEGFDSAVQSLHSAAQRAGLSTASSKIKTSDIPKAYRDFESMIMQNFVSNMMPKETSDLFGKGSAGEIYKGMAAEQYASAIAKAGGVGIAEQMYKQALAAGTIKPTDDAQQKAHAHHQALGMVQEFERKVLKLAPDATAHTSKA